MKVTFNNESVMTENLILSKTDRQEIAVKQWVNAKGIGTLNIIPRFGKTRIALMIIERLQKARPNIKTVIVVPSAPLTSQWRLEIDKYEGAIMHHHIIIVTRASLKRVNPDLYGLIIYDEVHKICTTTTNKDTMLKLKSIQFTLALTGTLPSKQSDKDFILNNIPVVDTINEEEALANKWINKYDEYNLILPFPHDAKYIYNTYSKHITETLKQFKGTSIQINSANIYNGIFFGFKSDYDVIMSCLSGRKDLTSNRYVQGREFRDIVGKINGWSVTLNLHDSYDKQIEKYWSPDAILNRVLTFNNFVRDRKKLIDEHQTKLDTIVELISNDFTKETLVYVGSIDIADELVENINRAAGKDLAIAFHSKIASRPLIDPSTNDYFRYKTGSKKGLPRVFGKKKLKEFYVESLKQKYHTILVTVESLNEGLNIPNLKRVISASGTRNSITHRQRTARVKTIDEQDLSKVGEIINITFDDFKLDDTFVKSVDLTKLKERQKDNDATPVYVDMKFFQNI